MTDDLRAAAAAMLEMVDRWIVAHRQRLGMVPTGKESATVEWLREALGKCGRKWRPPAGPPPGEAERMVRIAGEAAWKASQPDWPRDGLSPLPEDTPGSVFWRQVRAIVDALGAARAPGGRADDGLLTFARKVIDAALEGDDPDGSDIQDWAAEAGLLIPTEVTERCHPDARACEEFGFPTTCYRYSPLLRAASPSGATPSEEATNG